MLNIISKIEIQQVAFYTPDGKGGLKSDERNKLITITNPKSFDVSSSCEDIVQTGQFILSRKTNLIQSQDTDYAISGIPFINNNSKITRIKFPELVAGFVTTIKGATQLFKYGDMVRIYGGYTYFDASGLEHNSINEGNYKMIDGIEYYKEEITDDNFGLNSKRSLLFTGYITEISAQMDIVIKCQDYMAFFYQLRLPDHQFSSSDSTLLPSKSIPSILEYSDGTKQKYAGGTLQGILSKMIYGATSSGGMFDVNYNALKLKPIYTDFISTLIKIPGTNLTTYGDGSNSEFKLLLNTTSKNDRFGEVKIEHATIGDYFKMLHDNGWAFPYFYPNSYVLNLSIFKYNNNPEVEKD